MRYLAGVMAVTAACGSGGGPSSTDTDAAPAAFVEQASFHVEQIHLAAGDIDNDGDVDLYMISDGGGATSSYDKVARNDGAGTLVLDDGATVDQDCTRPRLERVDQDAFVDLVCLPTLWGGVSARLNQAGVSFTNAGYDGTSAVAARAWPAMPSSVIAATSDGLLALAIAPDSTQMARTTLAAGSFTTLAVGDLDGDGAAELIAGADGVWSVFAGSDHTRHDVAGAAGALETMDLDRDGHPDLVAIDGSSIGIALVTAGAPATPTLIDGPAVDADHVIADYDGDGVDDLLFVGVGPQVFVMRGTGTGSLNPPEALVVAGTLPTYMTGRNLSAIADFNRDGKLDLAISDVQAHVVTIYKGL